MTVTDTGCGMNAETRERIFEPFYTTKEIGRGTGLGLATVYGIVSQNQGCIEVESEPGKGSTFKVYWPVLEKEEKVTTNLEEEDWTKLPGGSETILVVEDDAAVREIACRHLRRAGYQVIEAENGAQALDLIAVGGGRDIDLVFTDIVMPVLDGWELEHRVREHYPEIRIHFATGYFDEHLRDAAAGALSSRDILDKPYQPGELLRRIRQILDTSVG
jgi:CheY-like chemotaxis protein